MGNPIEVTITNDATGVVLVHSEGTVVKQHMPGGGIAGAVHHGDGTANYRVEHRGKVIAGPLEPNEDVSIPLPDELIVTIQLS